MTSPGQKGRKDNCSKASKRTDSKSPPSGFPNLRLTQDDGQKNSNMSHDQESDGLEGGPPAIKTLPQNHPGSQLLSTLKKIQKKL